MNKATLLTLPCLLTTLLAPAHSYGEDFLLYTPKPAEKDQLPASPDEGILVRSVTVKHGDTLSKLSHKYIGRASWYPQVLLFNSIENPDLIYTGDKLLVPVPSEQAAAAEKKGAAEKKHPKVEKRGARHRAAVRHKAAAQPEAAQPEAVAKPETVKPQTLKRKAAKPMALPRETVKPEAAKPATVKPEAVKQKPVKPEVSRVVRPEIVRPVATDEQGSYQQAKLAYLKGDYQSALELFTQFRSKYPGSTFSADVALYQADCLLHLSGE
jgi:LysM repeat protein